MAFLQFLLTLAVSYLGLLAGFFLAFIAKEEMPHGRRHIYQLQRAIFFVLLIIFLVWLNVNWILIILICAVLAVIVGFLHLFRKKITHAAIYGLFGAFLALIKDSGYFALSAGLIFLYGISTGSFFTEKKNDWRSLLRDNLLYILAGIIFYFLF